MVEQVTHFNEIYDATYKSVIKLIAAKCGNVSDIADLTQDTYMELYQTMCRRGSSYVLNGKGLVLKIAKRKLAKHYGTKRPDVVSIDVGDGALDVPQSDFNLENFAITQATAEQAREILHQKSDDVQTIFTLFYDVELTIAEIAKTLGQSQSNVKNKLYRTLKELRAMMED